MSRRLVVVSAGLCLLVAGCTVSASSTTPRERNNGNTPAATEETIEFPSAPSALDLPADSDYAASPGCMKRGERRVPPVDLRLNPFYEAASNGLAPLPRSQPNREVTFFDTFESPEQYVAMSPSMTQPAARLAAMQRDGFSGGVNVGYTSGTDEYGVIMLRFRDAAAAMDYYRVHLRDVCIFAVQSASLPGLPGIAYLREDGEVKAVFVIGNMEIALNICSCVNAKDPLALVAQWAVAVEQQLGARGATA